MNQKNLGKLLLVAIVACAGCAQPKGEGAPPQPSVPSAMPAATPVAAQTPAPKLEGTSWQLVQFQGGDDTVLKPDDKSKYAMAFDEKGRVSVRIDCNRGAGTWKSSGAPQLEFGPLALTRMMCPPVPLTDRLAKDWEYVRSYVVKDGHLFLSLMADGGIYEWELTGQPQ